MPCLAHATDLVSGCRMTTRMKRRLARARALTSGIAAGSLSRYAADLLRRLGQGWPLTLAEYVSLEEALVPLPSRRRAGMRQTECMPQHTWLIERAQGLRAVSNSE